MTTIQRLRELEGKATCAPWENDGCSRGDMGIQHVTADINKSDIVIGGCGCCSSPYGDNAEDDRPFIIALRNAAPYLFAVVEAAEESQRGGAFCSCHLLDGKKCPDCTLAKALADLRNAQ